MIVNKKNWHYRLYKRLTIEENLNKPVSVCAYWGKLLFITPIMICIGMPVLILVTILTWPLYKVHDWFASKCKGKLVCPYGMVEFKD